MMNELELKIVNIKNEQTSLSQNVTVLSKLSDIFGPNCIQHFIFFGIVNQIETIANAYLSVLANGGIQLSLYASDESDKILKTVFVLGNDGTMRERGLSQLSGGQWRRVSLALDLAFAEVVRRRGALRSNVIVMDEVLTHLDASGREAVGSVLRLLVEGPKISVTDGSGNSSSNSSYAISDDANGGDYAVESNRPNHDDVFDLAGENFDIKSILAPRNDHKYQRNSANLIGGGAYETVLIILQDLAAVEMEESFDHVDVVVKDSFSARVVPDGV
jgi:hypothetical protein